MDIVISGPVGLEGTAGLAVKYRDRLAERYSEAYICRAESFCSRTAACPEDCEVTETGSDGISGALWHMAKERGCGFRIDLRAIPLMQETVEFCNLLDLDPYRLDSGKCRLFLCESGAKLLWMLREQGFEDAAIVGHTTGDHKKILLYDGVERYLTPPERENKGGESC